MTNEILNKVAKSLVDEYYGIGLWDSQGDAFRKRWVLMARAAIAAMREPTEGMVDEGWARVIHTYANKSSLSVAYEAMIDAALKEGE